MRAVVLIAHGILEHALCYYPLAIREFPLKLSFLIFTVKVFAALAEAGYAVYVMDNMGHGDHRYFNLAEEKKLTNSNCRLERWSARPNQ